MASLSNELHRKMGSHSSELHAEITVVPSELSEAIKRIKCIKSLLECSNYFSYLIVNSQGKVTLTAHVSTCTWICAPSMKKHVAFTEARKRQSKFGSFY